MYLSKLLGSVSPVLIYPLLNNKSKAVSLLSRTDGARLVSKNSPYYQFSFYKDMRCQSVMKLLAGLALVSTIKGDFVSCKAISSSNNLEELDRLTHEVYNYSTQTNDNHVIETLNGLFELINSELKNTKPNIDFILRSVTQLTISKSFITNELRYKEIEREINQVYEKIDQYIHQRLLKKFFNEKCLKFEDSNSIVENIDFTRLIQDDQFAIQTLKKIYRNNNKFFFYNIDIDDLVINFRETSKFKYSDLNVSNDIDFRLAFLYRNLSIRYKKNWE